MQASHMLPKNVLDDKELSLHSKLISEVWKSHPLFRLILVCVGVWLYCANPQTATTSCGGVKFNASTVCWAAT